ncbi:MAG TPA: PDZ domain-containing protein [Pirellulaceae bacterium]|nr:PDZ domain-containing protein [Pirellulaceae bacterium]
MAYFGVVWAAALLSVSPAMAQSRSVLKAFGDVISQAAQSTVQIRINGNKQPSALGTIVAADGYVLTKASEVKGKIECQLLDGRRFEARLVGLDKNTDLAVLKIDAQDLPTIQWREGDELTTGAWLATPGFDNSDPDKIKPAAIATGVVSVTARKIPSPPAAMGVKLEERDDVAMVKEVMDDSPAQKAGVLAGDVIRKIDGKQIATSRELIATVSEHQPGDKIRLTIEREDTELAIEVVLGSRMQILVREMGAHGGIDRADFQNHLGGELSERRAGFPSAIQHDTVLKPSDCGGPIVDLSGKVVGINIARAGRVESFALPASLVQSLLPDLMSGKLNPNPQTEAVAEGTKPVVEEEKKVQ